MDNFETYFRESDLCFSAYESTLTFGEVLGGFDELSPATEGFDIKGKLTELGKMIAAFFIKIKNAIVSFFKNLIKPETEVRLPNYMKTEMSGVIKSFNDATSRLVSSIKSHTEVNEKIDIYYKECENIIERVDKLVDDAGDKKKGFPKKEDYTVTISEFQKIVDAGIIAMEKYTNATGKIFNNAKLSPEDMPSVWSSITHLQKSIMIQSNAMTRSCTRLVNASAKNFKVKK